jgi:hypothetical protein
MTYAMTSMRRKSLSGLAGMAAGVYAALSLTSAFGTGASVEQPSRAKTGIEMDTWYDVSNPKLIAGEALFVVTGTVEEPVRIDGDRTVFRVSVEESLKGTTPESVLVSQLGFVDGDGNRYELEGFPLMELGHSYIMALAAPTTEEAQDALTLLSGSANGNKVEVTGMDDPRVAWFKSMIKKAENPHPANESTYAVDSANADRWLGDHPSYSSPGLAKRGS